MPINYNVPIFGFNPLRINPGMPSLATITNPDGTPANQRVTNFAQNYPRIDTNDNPFQTPVDTSNSQYEMKSKYQFGLNFGHIAASNAVQAVGAFFRGQQQRKDFRDYDKAQQNPLLQLPQNPNTSQQALYGEKLFKKGGMKKYPGGGPTGPDTPANGVLTNKMPDPNAKKYNMIDMLNYGIGSGQNPLSTKEGRIFAMNNTDPNTRQLLDAVTLFNQRSDIQNKNPEERIQQFYNMPSSNPVVEDYRTRTRNLGQGILNFNRTSPSVGNQEQIMASRKKGGLIRKDGGGFSDDFNQDDIDDLKDDKEELEDYLDKIRGENISTQKEEPKEEEGNKPEEQPAQEQEVEYEPHRTSTSGLEGLANQNDEEENGTTPDWSGAMAPTAMSVPTGHPLINAFKDGIAKVENANYFEKNQTDPKSTAFGRYQINDATRENIRGMLFPNVKKDDFNNAYKKDPQFQEKVMDGYGAYLLNKYGGDVHKAAVSFFLGEGAVNKANQPDYRPTPYNATVGQYLKKFDQGFGSTKFKEGGEYELTDLQISQLRKQGYEIEIIK